MRKIRRITVVRDKRGQERKYLSAETLVRHNGTGEQIEAVLLNISSYGACFSTSTHLKGADMVNLALKVTAPDGVIESEELLCTVRWVERDSGVYTAGISFDKKIKEEAYPLFIKCLEYTQSRM